ncbi:MAG: type II toxin-antitoxin system RelE/ParE family toxin [Planctomycetes bacterium]|nr:type II toxin-antitoxin system RelE/ParE family toxin [Planctomycetota bacterium]
MSQPPRSFSVLTYVIYDIYCTVNDDKPLIWLGGEVKTPPFSAEARLEAGVLLRRLQKGEKLALPHSRPMSDIGRGCHELRIVDRNATWRLIYNVDVDAVTILEVFSKKTKATPHRVIDTCRKRLAQYKDIMRE